MLLSLNKQNRQHLFRDIFDSDLFLNFYRRELNLFSDKYNITLQLLPNSVRLDNRKTYKVSKIDKLNTVTNKYR